MFKFYRMLKTTSSFHFLDIVWPIHVLNSTNYYQFPSQFFSSCIGCGIPFQWIMNWGVVNIQSKHSYAYLYALFLIFILIDSEVPEFQDVDAPWIYSGKGWRGCSCNNEIFEHPS